MTVLFPGLLVLAAIALALVLIAGLLVWRGYVLSVLWGWFAVPIFGLPALSVAQAIGAALVVAALTGRSRAVREKQEGVGLAVDILGPLLLLGVGYVAKGYL